MTQPEGNYFDKYNSSNFIIKSLMNNFFLNFKTVLNAVNTPKTILEVGCGEGNISKFLYDYYDGNVKIEAFDISENIISKASIDYPSINFKACDIYSLKEINKYDLVVCSEVLEHLQYPDKALNILLNATKQYVFLSVPNEPIWRILNIIRGKYVFSLGNTPGHIQHWGGRQFINFLKTTNAEVMTKAYPLPWQMVLIKKNEEHL